jgi:hypothetical protein
VVPTGRLIVSPLRVGLKAAAFGGPLRGSRALTPTRNGDRARGAFDGSACLHGENRTCRSIVSLRVREVSALDWGCDGRIPSRPAVKQAKGY